MVVIVIIKSLILSQCVPTKSIVIGRVRIRLSHLENQRSSTVSNLLKHHITILDSCGLLCVVTANAICYVSPAIFCVVQHLKWPVNRKASNSTCHMNKVAKIWIINSCLISCLCYIICSYSASTCSNPTGCGSTVVIVNDVDDLVNGNIICLSVCIEGNSMDQWKRLVGISVT